MFMENSSSTHHSFLVSKICEEFGVLLVFVLWHYSYGCSILGFIPCNLQDHFFGGKADASTWSHFYLKAAE